MPYIRESNYLQSRGEHKGCAKFPLLSVSNNTIKTDLLFFWKEVLRNITEDDYGSQPTRL
jgi:hypothetical protein